MEVGRAAWRSKAQRAALLAANKKKIVFVRTPHR